MCSVSFTLKVTHRLYSAMTTLHYYFGNQRRNLHHIPRVQSSLAEAGEAMRISAARPGGTLLKSHLAIAASDLGSGLSRVGTDLVEAGFEGGGLGFRVQSSGFRV